MLTPVQDADFGISQAKTASGLRLVRPNGELDVYTVPRLQAFIDDLCREGVVDICLDLSQLRFIDSRGLGLLVGVTRQVREAGGRLVVAAARASIQRVFSISGIDNVITIVDLPEYEPPAA